jgi:ParB family chromosome partitioning protein
MSAHMRGLYRVNVNMLIEHPDNVRTVTGDVVDLAASIRSKGLLQPLVAEKVDAMHWRVLAGHRRLAAVRLLRWKEVPVLEHQETDLDEAVVLMLIENGQRKNLDPIEEAKALKTLSSRGRTNRAIASEIGRDEFYVSSRLRLLELSPEEQEAVKGKTLTIGEATATVRARRQDPRGNRSGNNGQHFIRVHPLAERARAKCRTTNHHVKPRLVGGTACGPCWEAVIREDAVLEFTTRDAVLPAVDETAVAG